MKRFILSAFVILVSFVCLGQETIKFLDIPVDGKKTEVIAKLILKGFQYDRANDCLEGVFNGKESTLFIHENNGKVDRIMVFNVFPIALAKNEFNTLLKQFQSDEKYVSSAENSPISEEENISYELRVNGKSYNAAFYPDPFVEGGDKGYQDYIANTAARLALEAANDGELLNPTEERVRSLANVIANSLIIRTSTSLLWFRLTSLDPGTDCAIYIYYDNLLNQSEEL